MESNPRNTWGDPHETKEQVRVNPYKLFGIDPDTPLTKDYLRHRMRKLVLVTHPDKPTGSPKKFKIVMECYKHLLHIYEEQQKTIRPVNDQTIRGYEDSRKDERDSFDIPNANARRFGAMETKSDAFNHEAFNKFFEENRLDDSMKKGHGDWLKAEDDDYESSHRKKVGKGQFQEAFEQERQRLLKKRELVKHTGIVGVSLGKSSIASTDIDDIGIMSNQNSGTMRCKNGVMGVDLREALEIGVLGVDSGESHSDRPITMEEAQRARSSARIEYTAEEKEFMRRTQEEEDKAEKERRRRIEERQHQINLHFQRINGLITNH